MAFNPKMLPLLSLPTVDDMAFDLPVKDTSKLYDVGAFLGRGSTSVVYSCRRHQSTNIDTTSGTSDAAAKSSQQFALKMFSKHKLDTAHKQKVLQEICVMKRLSSLCRRRYVVGLFDAFQDNDHVVLILEKVFGGDLFDRIASLNHYSERKAMQCMREIYRGIEFLHENGVVHRDIKPENILLLHRNDDFHIKIADFGESTLLKAGETVDEMVGTFAYMAPEVTLGMPYGFPVDIWSAGVVCFAILSGEMPFDSTASFKSISHSIQNLLYDFDSDVWRNDISSEAKDFIVGVLDGSPISRPTATQALQHRWFQTGGPDDEGAVVPPDGCSSNTEKRADIGAANISWGGDRVQPASPSVDEVEQRTQHLGSTMQKLEEMNQIVQVTGVVRAQVALNRALLKIRNRAEQSDSSLLAEDSDIGSDNGSDSASSSQSSSPVSRRGASQLAPASPSAAVVKDLSISTSKEVPLDSSSSPATSGSTEVEDVPVLAPETVTKAQLCQLASVWLDRCASQLCSSPYANTCVV